MCVPVALLLFCGFHASPTEHRTTRDASIVDRVSNGTVRTWGRFWLSSVTSSVSVCVCSIRYCTGTFILSVQLSLPRERKNTRKTGTRHAESNIDAVFRFWGGAWAWSGRVVVPLFCQVESKVRERESDFAKNQSLDTLITLYVWFSVDQCEC